jgi:hypothetical protein
MGEVVASKILVVGHAEARHIWRYLKLGESEPLALSQLEENE